MGCASKLVFEAMRKTLDGEFTVSDGRLLPLLRLLNGSEGIFVEPSAAISAAAYMGMMGESCTDYLKNTDLTKNEQSCAYSLGNGRRTCVGDGAK